jgi:hypothetical protein
VIAFVFVGSETMVPSIPSRHEHSSAGSSISHRDAAPRGIYVRGRRIFLGRALVAAGVIGAFLTLMGSGLVKCPWAGLFHAPCPACGSTRAARALLRLDFASVLKYNPIAPFVVAILAAIAVRVVWLFARDGHARTIDEERLGQRLLLGLVAAVTLEIVVWGLRWFGVFGGPCPI